AAFDPAPHPVTNKGISGRGFKTDFRARMISMAVCLAVICGVFMFYMFTIRAGQPWPDDFAMYVHEAENLVNRVPLSRTGYIYDPYNPSLGPRLYPPLFPFLLAPADAIGGVANLKPMKIEIIVFFIGLLLVLSLGLGTLLSPISRAALLGIVGFRPVFWSYKDILGSDIPFAFFLFVTLAAAAKLARRPCNHPKVWRVLVLAALVYCCYGMRTMGIVLIPSLVLLGILNWRRNGRPLCIAAGLALIPCLLQLKFFGGEASYVDQLRLGPRAFVAVLLRNTVTYAWSLATFWSTPYGHLFRDCLFALMTLLALVAYLKRIRVGPGIYEIFLPLYLLVVLLWPNPGGERYLLPIFPLYAFYSLDALTAIAPRLRVPWPQYASAAIIVVVVLAYASEFGREEYGPFRDGMENAQTKQLFEFIRSDTRPDDVFVFRRPRALSLYTDRSASVYPEPRQVTRFADYFRTIGATYLIEAPSLDDADFEVFIEQECPAKHLVFSNSDFRVFQVSPGASGCGQSESRIAESTGP